MTIYKCGCMAKMGLIVRRCAWAAETKARINELEGTVRLAPVMGFEIGRDGVQVIDCVNYDWADREEAGRLIGELLRHYQNQPASDPVTS